MTGWLLRVPVWVWVVLVGCAVAFPRLGATALWDDDEGVNAACTREMIEARSWIIPTFNWDLRTAKPILLYWVMRGSVALCGETEFAARLPSAVAFVLMLLVLYDLARRMVCRITGLVAAVIAAGTLELVKLGHAATTDSLLILFTVCYAWGLWAAGKFWPIACGAASAFLMLTKGPAVGLILPSAVAGVWFVWNRDLAKVKNPRLILGVLLWIVIAVPGYVLVTTETKGEWARAFFLNENLARASEPKENHGGLRFVSEFVYICLFSAPYSAFLYGMLIGAVRERTPAVKLLLAWVGVYFLAFGLAATKLPHYIAPLYPALAILTARYLTAWLRGAVVLWWAMRAAALGYIFMGVLISVACIVGGGVLPWNFAKLRVFPGLGLWAWIGLVPLVAGGLMFRFSTQPKKYIPLATLAPVLLMLLLVVGVLPVIDAQKAVKPLVLESRARQLEWEVRIGRFEYTRPSITYYTARRVEHLMTPTAAAEFLMFPVPSYLFIPEPDYIGKLLPLLGATPHVIAAKHYDYERNQQILVVVNTYVPK